MKKLLQISSLIFQTSIIDESQYQHHPISNLRKIPQTQKPSLKFPSFEPKTLPSLSSSDPVQIFGEFSTLNPRLDKSYIEQNKEQHQRQQQIKIQDQKSPAFLKTDEISVATPIFNLPQANQESYETKFQSSQPVQQTPSSPSSVKTNIQPFVYFPTVSARSSLSTNDNNG